MRRSTRSLVAALGLVTLVSCGSNDAATTDAQATAASTSDPAETAAGAPAVAETPAPPAAAVTAAPEATSAPAETQVPVAAPAETAAPVVVPEALQFAATLVGGGDIDFAAFAGQPVALWFWAPG